MLRAVFVAMLLSLANSSAFLAGVARTAPGEVYLGTIHYWEDYFLYVSQFVQGAHGGWLTKNLYTSEPTPASTLFWPNVLLGKLGGLAGLAPQETYNISVLLLSFAVLLTIASVMRRAFPDPTKAFVAFLMAGTATSFMNRIAIHGQWVWYPFEQWKTPNFALDRLGGVPHQTIQTLLFLLAMRARTAFSLLVSIAMLTSLHPVMSALFLAASWIASPGKRLIAPSLGFLIVAWYYNAQTNAQPHIQSKLWEATDQTATSPLFLLLSIGPISVLGILGAWAAASRFRPVHRFSIALLALSYLLYFSPLPRLAGISNSRVLFPALYAAWGILAAEGAYAFKKPLVVAAVFLLLTLPTLGWEIQRKLAVKPQERTPLLYLPESVFQAFSYLKHERPHEDIVLANPASHMDALVPAFSGHTGYTGHPLATIASREKQENARRFFSLRMTAEEARAWLANANIRYVLVTQFDGDAHAFGRAYPFLTRPFSSQGASVWSFRR